MRNLDPAIVGAGLYYEGRVGYAERLGLEFVLDGEAGCPGSRALNHAESSASDIMEVPRRWQHPSGAGEGGAWNAGGAWIDRVNAQLVVHGRRPRVRVSWSRTRRFLAALKERSVYFGTADGTGEPASTSCSAGCWSARPTSRSTTPTPPAVTPTTAYLCAAVAEVFPKIPVHEDQITIIRFSASSAQAVPTPPTSAVSPAVWFPDSRRRRCPARPVRSTASSAASGPPSAASRSRRPDQVLAHLGRPRRVAAAGMRSGGGRDFPRDPAARPGAGRRAAAAASAASRPPRGETLLSRYGTRARAYCESLTGRGETMLASLPTYAREELLHLCRTERAGTLDDLLRRRAAPVGSGQPRGTQREYPGPSGARPGPASIAGLCPSWMPSHIRSSGLYIWSITIS